MTLEDIRSGESKNLEFKRIRPDRSINYTKTVVAFANGAGGKIIFGIDDKTGEIVGISEETVFSEMDAIANAISDSCEPTILPDIYMQSVEEKTIIVVDISSGRQRPYFIKSAGRDQGTYVRVAGTTRLADEDMILELLFEGKNRYYDQTICLGLDVSNDDMDSLCYNMKETAIRNAKNDGIKAAIKDVSAQQLLSWGLLVKQEGTLCPTNAYEILTGQNGTVIQCAVFKGKTRAVFVDRREFDGWLPDQIDQAYQFVLRNIHLGAVFEGIYRKDVYEIPPDAIRELIINAVIHRSYIDHGNILVAIYDDRLEVTSPGKLAMGQTIDQMKNGHSKIRNEALAHAFYYMNLIEHWGSGIPRIIGEVTEAGLCEPEFMGGDTDLTIDIYRRNSGDDIGDASGELWDSVGITSEEHRDGVGRTSEERRKSVGRVSEECRKNVGINLENEREKSVANEMQSNILELLSKNPYMTSGELSEQIHLSERGVERNIRKLKDMGILIRHGAKKGGYWEIKDGDQK